MAETQSGNPIRDSYATKLTLSLAGVVALATAAGVLVYFQARSLFGAEAGVIGSSILGLILVTVISLALIGVTIGSNTIIALRRLTTKADRMAEGDLDVDLDTKRTDEIGQLHRAFDSMRRSLREQISAAETAQEDAQAAQAEMEQRAERIEQKAAEYERVMQAVADGDLTQRVDPDTDSEAMQQVGIAFNETLDELEETVSEVMTFADHVEDAAAGVDSTAEQLYEDSSGVANAVEDISDGAHRQTENLREVADEMDGLSSGAEERSIRSPRRPSRRLRPALKARPPPRTPSSRWTPSNRRRTRRWRISKCSTRRWTRSARSSI